MSRTSEEMLDVMWHFTAVRTDVEASVLLFSVLYESMSLQYPYLNWARVARSFLVISFSELLIG